MGEVISVIVPVHNAEVYLDQCLNSLIKQTYKELEIILVDDNSTDSSGMLCDSYARRDSRIRVIHNVCGGEGGAKARNTGMKEATGDCLYFMDSDDYIEQNMLAEMYDIMCREGSQCTVCSFHYVDDQGSELAWRTPELKNYSCMSGIDAAKVFLTTLDIEGFSWNKLFRKELILNYDIQFDESMNSFVDMYAMFQSLLKCEKVCFCNKQFYYYRQRQASCVHTMSLRKLDNYHRVVSRIAENAKESGLIVESNYFYTYRMMLQLFDAVKDKTRYTKKEWEQLKSTYRWKNIFKNSICKIRKILFLNSAKSKLKNSIKLLIVWIHFI